MDVTPPDVSKSSWRTVGWLVRAALKSQVLILNGSAGFDDKYVDLLAAAVVKLLHLRTRVFMTDANWEPTSRAIIARFPKLEPLLPHAARLTIRLIDSPRVTYGVFSTAETETFPRTWNIPPERVRFTPFTHTLWPPPEADQQVFNGGYAFAGGNSLRDYELLAAAMSKTEILVRVAADWTPPGPLGENFDIGSRSHPEFMRLLRECSVCVVPLQQSVRSAGQQTYLNAMLLKKIVVVTDAPGVRDYIEHGVTGLIVPPRPAELRAAVRDAVSERSSPFFEAMAQKAHERVATTFTPIQYRRRILGLAEEMLIDV